MKSLSIIVAVVLLGLIGRIDYQDAVRQEENYCDMVKSGKWPAYRDDIVCSKVEGK